MDIIFKKATPSCHKHQGFITFEKCDSGLSQAS